MGWCVFKCERRQIRLALAAVTGASPKFCSFYCLNPLTRVDHVLFAYWPLFGRTVTVVCHVPCIRKALVQILRGELRLALAPAPVHLCKSLTDNGPGSNTQTALRVSTNTEISLPCAHVISRHPKEPIV